MQAVRPFRFAILLVAAHFCAGCSKPEKHAVASDDRISEQAETIPVQASVPVDRPPPDPWESGSDRRLLTISTSDTHEILYVTNLREDGATAFYRITPKALQGGGGVKLADEALGQVREILKTLPPSTTKPLPDDRELVLHRFDGNTVKAFRYDFADAPEIVLDVLRRVGTEQPVWTLKFPQDGQWQAQRSDDGWMIHLAKRNLLVTCARYQPIRVWDEQTHRLTHEIEFSRPHSESADQMDASPDERYIATTGSACMILDTTTWKIIGPGEGLFKNANDSGCGNPTFVPDGSSLFLRTSAMESGFYETGTWKPISRPKGFPEGVEKFSHLSDKGRIMTLDGNGKLEMTGSEVPAITLREKGVTDFCCADTPSHHQLAVAIGERNQHARNDYRIFLFDENDGKPMRELLPFERFCRDMEIKGLFWSPKSDYVMAALEDGEIVIWNAKTGRHRGTLVGEYPPNRVISNADRTTLYSFGHDGVVRYWQMEPVLKKIRAFEQELEAEG